MWKNQIYVVKKRPINIKNKKKHAAILNFVSTLRILRILKKSRMVIEKNGKSFLN